jgi:DNA-binding transcriptional regulator YdaS (Cro superfamily)
MNQRIKQLAEQASVNDPPYNQFVESFAQLVAEDCAKIAREYTGEVMIQNEILKLYASDSSDFVKMKENVA